MKKVVEAFRNGSSSWFSYCDMPALFLLKSDEEAFQAMRCMN
jgi:hypothetical protein